MASRCRVFYDKSGYGNIPKIGAVCRICVIIGAETTCGGADQLTLHFGCVRPKPGVSLSAPPQAARHRGNYHAKRRIGMIPKIYLVYHENIDCALFDEYG